MTIGLGKNGKDFGKWTVPFLFCQGYHTSIGREELADASESIDRVCVNVGHPNRIVLNQRVCVMVLKSRSRAGVMN